MRRTPIELMEASQGIAQSGVLELLMLEEDKVVNELVSAYQSNKLADRDAAVGVATISAIRSISSRLARHVADGRRAGEALTQKGRK